jgi:hypothetical protein
MDIKKQVTFAILSIFGLIGAFLIGHGISGMIIYEPLVGEICMVDDDCPGDQVCCLFSESKSGVCATKDYCGDIQTMTVETSPEQYLVEQPALVAESRLETVTGISIVFLAIIVFYVFLRVRGISKELKKEEALVEEVIKRKSRKK